MENPTILFILLLLFLGGVKSGTHDGGGGDCDTIGGIEQPGPGDDLSEERAALVGLLEERIAELRQDLAGTTDETERQLILVRLGLLEPALAEFENLSIDQVEAVIAQAAQTAESPA